MVCCSAYVDNTVAIFIHLLRYGSDKALCKVHIIIFKAKYYCYRLYLLVAYICKTNTLRITLSLFEQLSIKLTIQDDYDYAICSCLGWVPTYPIEVYAITYRTILQHYKILKIFHNKS